MADGGSANTCCSAVLLPCPLPPRPSLPAAASPSEGIEALASTPASCLFLSSHTAAPIPLCPLLPPPAEGIEALANTRVVIRPAGKMAGEGYVDSYKVCCLHGYSEGS